MLTLDPVSSTALSGRDALMLPLTYVKPLTMCAFIGAEENAGGGLVVVTVGRPVVACREAGLYAAVRTPTARAVHVPIRIKCAQTPTMLFL
jgi:hypothetical protein